MLALAKPVLTLAIQQFGFSLPTNHNVEIEAELSLRPVGLNLRLHQRHVAV